jgi:hypothetical protein
MGIAISKLWSLLFGRGTIKTIIIGLVRDTSDPTGLPDDSSG